MVKDSLKDIVEATQRNVEVAVTRAIKGETEIMTWTKIGTSPDGEVRVVTVRGENDPNETAAEALARHQARVAEVEALYRAGELTWTNCS